MQTASAKLSGRCLVLAAWVLYTWTFTQQQHNHVPPRYFSCLLSMLAPFVALGKSQFFFAARSSSDVSRHERRRASALPGYNSQDQDLCVCSHPILKIVVLALTYLTKML